MRMLSASLLAVCALLFPCAMVLADDAKGPKVALKVGKGDTLTYSVKRNSSSEGSFGGNDFSTNEETEIQYSIEVADKKDNGDLALTVKYATVKTKQTGREQTFEFDSSKEAKGEDETAASLRGMIAKPVTATFSGGKVTKIEGFPEVQRPEGGDRGGFRRLQVLGSTAGQRALQRDLDIILCTAIQGQSLEKGKEYKPAPVAAAEGGGEGRRRGGRFGGGRETRSILKFEGEDQADGKKNLRFSLSAEPPADEGDGPRVEVKTEGSALVSSDDGILSKLEMKSESKSSFERDGQTSRTQRKSTTTITRSAPAKSSSGVKL